MHESLLPQLAAIIVMGVGAQWLAWRINLPSILLLLVAGIVAGPVTGWLQPDAIFGDLLSPMVSVSVGLILYEGGLTLKVSELPKVGAVVRNLVTLGAVVTWLITALAAYTILGLSLSLSVLLGAVLVVTGPTVIAPLLRHIRPTGAVGPVLRWEGIVIDPIGAMLTVIVYEVILIGEAKEATGFVAMSLLKTIVLGGGIGLTAAAILVLLLKRYWIADFLQSAVSLMLVVAAFAISNALQEESGLLAVTVMGFVLANQKYVDVESIVEFKENLRVLLIGTLFIVLAARLELPDATTVLTQGLPFVAVLIFVARPLSVRIATWGSALSSSERWFLSWMAPRGIVAAAIASVLALRLQERGVAGAETIVSATFITIIVTVAVYGLTSPILARRLGVAESNPQGILFVGASLWVRQLATLLQREGFRVLLVDSNREHTRVARMDGLPTHTGSILAEHTLDQIELGGLGRILAVTPNDWVNALSVRRFARLFGKAECYQLPTVQDAAKDKHRYLHGRWLFNEEVGFRTLRRKVARGFQPKATLLTEQFDFAAYRDRYGDETLPLLAITTDKTLRILVADDPPNPTPGETVISFVRDVEETA